MPVKFWQTIVRFWFSFSYLITVSDSSRNAYMAFFRNKWWLSLEQSITLFWFSVFICFQKESKTQNGKTFLAIFNFSWKIREIAVSYARQPEVGLLTKYRMKQKKPPDRTKFGFTWLMTSNQNRKCRDSVNKN